MIGILRKSSSDFSCNDIFLFRDARHWFRFNFFNGECKRSKLNKFGTGNLHPFPSESTWSIMEQIPASTIKALLNTLPAFSKLHYTDYLKAFMS